jgi:signal transduction histidine kinase
MNPGQNPAAPTLRVPRPRPTIRASAAAFELILGVFRTYLFDHTINRIDVELGARLFSLSARVELKELIGQRQGLLVQKGRYLEALEAIAALMETRIRTAVEYKRTLLDELTKAEQKAAGLAQGSRRLCRTATTTLSMSGRTSRSSLTPSTITRDKPQDSRQNEPVAVPTL